ncbi:MAG TPA: hypothetical protein VF868_15165 [Bacteroidia bacterium]|jgi:hypothetical protein
MGAPNKHGNAAKLSKWDKPSIIKEAIQKRIAGMSYAQIKEDMEKVHGISQRNAEYYIKDVAKTIQETYREAITPEQLALDLAETIARLNKLYDEAEKPADKLNILKEISELKGLKKGKGANTSDAPAMIPIQIVINRNDSVTTSPSAKMIEIKQTKNNSND